MTLTNNILLTDDNLFLFAAKHYQKTCLNKDEFLEDLVNMERFRSDITRYYNKLDPQLLRLILNKLIIYSNSFGIEATMKMLFFMQRNSELHVKFLKTVFEFLQVFPERLVVCDDFYITNKLEVDIELLKALQDATS